MAEGLETKPSEPKQELAEQNPPPGTPPDAVRAVGHLGLGDFFRRHRDHILDKLEECDEIAEKAKKNRDMIFFAESLPLIDGLIHVGTTREEYKNALQWVRNTKEWGEEVDPAHVLAALVFLYVAKTGEAIANGKYLAQDDEGKPKSRTRATWTRIMARVAKLEPEPAESAGS